MSRKLFVLAIAVVILGTICLSAYLASAAPPGPFYEPPGFDRGKPAEQAEDAIDAYKPITPGGNYERMVLIHYERPPWAGKPKDEEPPEPNNSAYALLDLQWVVPEGGVPYVIDPDYSPAGSVGEIEAAFEAWDDATSIELFAAPSVDTDAAPSVNAPDLVNTVSWRMVVPPKAIAVTFIWSNPADEIVDCDIVMNTKHGWGIDPDGEGTDFVLKKAFDVRNIATHEAGHVVGLDDLYDESHRELTMYGYSSKGETQKISLEEGDILGCQAIYDE